MIVCLMLQTSAKMLNNGKINLFFNTHVRFCLFL